MEPQENFTTEWRFNQISRTVSLLQFKIHNDQHGRPERHQWESGSKARDTQVPSLEQPSLLKMEKWFPEDNTTWFPFPKDREKEWCDQDSILPGQGSQWRLHGRPGWPDGHRQRCWRRPWWPQSRSVYLLPEAVWIHAAAWCQQVLPAYVWQSQRSCRWTGEGKKLWSVDHPPLQWLQVMVSKFIPDFGSKIAWHADRVSIKHLPIYHCPCMNYSWEHPVFLHPDSLRWCAQIRFFQGQTAVQQLMSWLLAHDKAMKGCD